jgi:hypothetical protein
MTSYNKRTYRVDEVDFSMSPRNEFTMNEKGDPKTLTYAEYFKTKYDAKIVDLN